MNGFRLQGKSAGKQCFLGWKPWFPVDFPLNTFIESIWRQRQRATWINLSVTASLNVDQLDASETLAWVQLDREHGALIDNWSLLQNTWYIRIPKRCELMALFWLNDSVFQTPSADDFHVPYEPPKSKKPTSWVLSFGRHVTQQWAGRLSEARRWLPGARARGHRAGGMPGHRIADGCSGTVEDQGEAIQPELQMFFLSEKGHLSLQDWYYPSMLNRNYGGKGPVTKTNIYYMCS